ncbi:hypothetical protein J2X52_000237 [Luteimonas sp. 3794]|nr:hypothetical protein [Luteimonas sp. 3794]
MPLPFEQARFEPLSLWERGWGEGAFASHVRLREVGKWPMTASRNTGSG